jgi:hypothetical protein
MVFKRNHHVRLKIVMREPIEQVNHFSYIQCTIPVFSLLSYFEKIEQAYEITLLSVCVCIPPINF